MIQIIQGKVEEITLPVDKLSRKNMSFYIYMDWVKV
jgi:hypothetical protein